MTYREFIEKFPDDESVAKYLIEKRFDGKIVCPFCGKTEKVYHQGKRKAIARYSNIFMEGAGLSMVLENFPSQADAAMDGEFFRRQI